MLDQVIDREILTHNVGDKVPFDFMGFLVAVSPFFVFVAALYVLTHLG